MGKPTTRAVGSQAEQTAVRYLQSQGYRIRDRNVLCGHYGELDVVAELDELLVVVEVRMKSNDALGEPSETVMFQKQRRVAKSALHYLQTEQLVDRVAVRFDVISVVGRGSDAQVEHIEDAFDAGF